jgi:deoxyribodipyrimidine photo-lyase
MEIIQRARLLNNKENKPGSVVYWMSRDQRAHDNYSLLFAQELALKSRQNLYVIFNLVECFPDRGKRQYSFMLNGLDHLRAELKNFNIPLYILSGIPGKEIPRFLKEADAGILVTDFDPLRIKREWKQSVADKMNIQFYEVDAHNIIPCWITSRKQEFAAYTIRPKINKLLYLYLEEYPKLVIMPDSNFPKNVSLKNKPYKDSSYPKTDRLNSGETEAISTLSNFLENKIDNYINDRNDPNKNCQSDLSPYLHFGQISSQRIALNIEKDNYNTASKESFLEEVIVRKELSDNFCYYNKNYDSFDGFPTWAKATLNSHRKDEREFVYSLEEFENGDTHDALWNAAQMEMVNSGKMHGYMRMYWAKKILEWSPSPEDALKTAIYLNDKFELDGNDANGYTGCAWSIGGVHDRAWFERPVFGKIRYMNMNGAARKFDINNYINTNKGSQDILIT